MRRAAPGVRYELDARLAHLQRQTPEWRAWTRLLEEALRALDDPAWGSPLAAPAPRGRGRAERGPDRATRPAPAGASSSGDRMLPIHPASPGAPLLDGLTLRVDGPRVRRLVRRLVETAATEGAEGAAALRRYRPSGGEALSLLAAAVRADRAAIEALADGAGVDVGALETVAQLAAVPLLHACGRLLQDGIPLSWPHGYCPICGAWPVLAELRGLDRARRLRCGRCGGDWRVNWLCCAYCGERDHEQLASLAPENRRETLRVETCNRCRGYLKSIATLQPLPAFELLLRDLETVELDLVALERGYSRPQGNGFPLDVRVTPETSRARWGLGRVARRGLGREPPQELGRDD